MKKFATLFLVIIMLMSINACKSNNSQSIKSEDIQMICKLSTLKCYYNNVAEIIKEKDNIFQVDRKMWIEYEGEVTIGIDMSKVKVEVLGDIVTVTLPEAEIQHIGVKEETLTNASYVTSEDSWFIENKISTEDQQAAISKGQEEMKDAVLKNDSLFIQAKSRAKELIENYILEIGKVIEHDYEIIWIDLPLKP